MIQINEEFRLVDDSGGSAMILERKCLKKYTGKIGELVKLDTPVEFWKSMKQYYCTIEAGATGVKRIYTKEIASEDKIYKIEEVIEFLKQKGL